MIIIFRSTGPVISQRRSRRSGGARRDAPLALADRPRLRQEPGQRAGVELELTLMPALEQLDAGRVQLSVEASRRTSSACCVRTSSLGDGAQAAASLRSNCASSVEPFSASVELSGDDRLCDEVEVAGADLALVARRRVAELLELELVLLELARTRSSRRQRNRARARTSPAFSEWKPGERDELEAVAPARELLLEAGDLVVVEMLAAS